MVAPCRVPLPTWPWSREAWQGSWLPSRGCLQCSLGGRLGVQPGDSGVSLGQGQGLLLGGETSWGVGEALCGSAKQ
jgi:hypothetical protein